MIKNEIADLAVRLEIQSGGVDLLVRKLRHLTAQDCEPSHKKHHHEGSEDKARAEAIERWKKAKTELENAVTCLGFVHIGDKAWEIHELTSRLDQSTRAIMAIVGPSLPTSVAA